MKRLLGIGLSLSLLCQAAFASNSRQDAIDEARDLEYSLGKLDSESSRLARQSTDRQIRYILEDVSDQAFYLSNEVRMDIVEPLRDGERFSRVLSSLNRLDRDFKDLEDRLYDLRRVPYSLDQLSDDIRREVRRLEDTLRNDYGSDPSPTPGDSWVCLVTDNQGRTFTGFGVREGQATNAAFDRCFNESYSQRCSLISCRRRY
ncbi:hypothetical protein [Pseudobacteriovorax antillogorgiicola]|uniref:Uncharacterized protein n=1 Tax=Pseudobacteriovorax antillogorgiicola TaxID=1513793 RepID=A0A1Y6CQU3_9BACT|nr:hypothetical protein [Pseudobacteriovorax antillogorgiicola]TCS40917.1 hypothetical protein EDD56_1513 [Pseudobacteriovorax antillogorgiicola]SMF83963.1 hypothetical protein SAMN06296036_1513 [Pseudobacteriovorax antillogorgiicola]